MSDPFLSKSKYLAGLQCSKLLWYYYNRKDAFPPPDAQQQAIFDQGHEVGRLARTLFPNGIEVGEGIIAPDEVVRLSEEAVKFVKPIFEAGFRWKNAYARADILNPNGKGKWDIIEVKSSTGVKDINLHDLALQKFTYDNAGVRIDRCYLLFVNNEYVRKGEIDLEKLFVREDVTDRVEDLVAEVEKDLDTMVRVIKSADTPDVRIGPHCSDPYTCPLTDLCWEFLPDDNVFTLTRLGRKAFPLLERGITEITGLPPDFKLTERQKIQYNALKRGKAHVNKVAINDFLHKLKYPLFFLDFETFGTALPMYDDTRPYQQVPFQFSVHILRSASAPPEHEGFLGEGDVDPRPEFLARLKALLGTRGSIVAYNASFEKSRMRESCEVYPEYAGWWESAESRMVDLFEPFRSFHYYHPSQRGSASIKAVLPALTGKGYDTMAIGDGGKASAEYLRVTFGDVEQSEKEKVRGQLEEYCGLDTAGMIGIVNALRRL